LQVQDAIRKLEARQDLAREEAREVLAALLSGSVPDAQIMALLLALRDKGATVEELVGFAEVMRARAAETLREAGVDLNALHGGGPLLDTCGTGGDEKGTFNISTATALVAAAAGARVAKHGNRSISSRSGSADLLEALGVELEIPFDHIPDCLDETGFVFLFAPKLHHAMKHVMNARRALKTKTVFNLLGPLTNPLGATVQLVGVYDRNRTEMMARGLQLLGSTQAFAVTGHDGIDEITLTGPTRLSEAARGEISTREINPEDFGLPHARPEDMAGGDGATNARLLREIFEGKRGALRDLVLANASAALVVAGRANDFPEGVALAAEAIDSGAASATVDRLIEFTKKVSS
jgi:anthranilate phosphoribosyltransferase